MIFDVTTFELPTDTPLFTMRATLAGQEYVLRFDYSGKEDRWYLTIADLEGNALAKGIKVVPNTNILSQRYHIAALPQEPAMLFFACPTGEAPTLATFGRAMRLVMMTPEVA